MRLIPLDHPIPAGIERERFRLRPITVNDLVRDYDAVISSAPRLREHFPFWGWPSDEMTLEQDLVDLGWHQKEAQLRRSFNYACVAPDEGRLLGCVYVDPPEKEGADAEVCLWVRTDEEGTGLEQEVEAAVRDWLAAEWPFETVRWPGREISWEQWDALEDSGR
jgi:RimJ/RimL family protein N-acetyltransferase